MSLATRPFKKNQYGHPTLAIDSTVGFPVDHSHNDGKGGAKPGTPAPDGGAPQQFPGKPGAGSTPGMGKGARP